MLETEGKNAGNRTPTPAKGILIGLSIVTTAFLTPFNLSRLVVRLEVL